MYKHTHAHMFVYIHIHTHTHTHTHTRLYRYPHSCIYDFHLSIYLEICFKELTHGSHDYRGLVKTISDRIGLQIGGSGKKMQFESQCSLLEEFRFGSEVSHCSSNVFHQLDKNHLHYREQSALFKIYRLKH